MTRRYTLRVTEGVTGRLSRDRRLVSVSLRAGSSPRREGRDVALAEVVRLTSERNSDRMAAHEEQRRCTAAVSEARGRIEDLQRAIASIVTCPPDEVRWLATEDEARRSFAEHVSADRELDRPVGGGPLPKGG